MNRLSHYQAEFEKDPLSYQAIHFVKEITKQMMNPETRHRSTFFEKNLANNSWKAWETIQKVNSAKPPANKAAVTPMQKARKLIENGIPKFKVDKKAAHDEVRKVLKEPNMSHRKSEWQNAVIIKLKNGKRAISCRK